MTFAFDGHYAMFDATPVDNQFIMDCVPMAKGDYVRVYLYGLMGCYHPEIDLDISRMSHDLDLPEEEIKKAYRYWERRGLVRRVSDTPPAWQYVNGREKSLAGSQPADPEYEAFAEALYGVFDNDRRLHGKEIQTCYEWVEDLKLPMEAVIMLLKHMARIKGKNFTIQSAGKVALEMAEEQVSTLEEAEAFLSRDQQIWEGVRRVLRKLGKKGMPSEAQTELYRKWIREWRFTPEAVEAACAETAKGEPNMGYLDGILKNVRQEASSAETIDLKLFSEIQEQGGKLKETISRLGGGMTEENRHILMKLENEYSPEVLRIGVRECAAGHRNIEELEKLLEAWRKRGLYTETEVEAYVAEFHRQNELLRQLREKWNGNEPRIGETSRKRAARWETELGFSEEMILKTAEYANEAKAPMAYLDKLLTSFHEKGIRTPEEAEQEHRKARAEHTETQTGNGTRTVNAQQYSQREYEEEHESPEAMLSRLKEEMGDA